MSIHYPFDLPTAVSPGRVSSWGLIILSVGMVDGGFKNTQSPNKCNLEDITDIR